MEDWAGLKKELNVAFNEATLLGFEVDATRRLGAATFGVLTLPVEGVPPEDSRVQVLFSPVGRVTASLRKGRWDDPSAEVIPFQLSELLGIVQSFRGQPIYGWEFFDVHDDELLRWRGRVSLDWRSGSDGIARSMSVTQESQIGPKQFLSLIVWFDKLTVRTPDGAAVDVDEFAAGGRRWWDGLFAGDERTRNAGIFPLKPPDVEEKPGAEECTGENHE